MFRNSPNSFGFPNGFGVEFASTLPSERPSKQGSRVRFGPTAGSRGRDRAWKDLNQEVGSFRNWFSSRLADGSPRRFLRVAQSLEEPLEPRVRMQAFEREIYGEAIEVA